MASWDFYKTNIHNKWKKKWFENHPDDIAEYSWNYLFTGGKELRSKLFCELWVYLSPDSEVFAELAFAIECVHVASIVLDDTPWMDNASHRRGRTTLHAMFSPKKAALIAGEVLYMAVEIWRTNKPDHIDEHVWKSILISKLQRLTSGQWLDLEKKGNLVELASLKTGVLFELVTETVATCIKLDTEFWKIWGNNLGVLFQWMDDWLDREEDIVQNNRNAFNESPDITLKNYISIWQKLEKNIGPQWFNRPLGIFMKKYFIEQLNIVNIESLYMTNLNEVCIPYPNNIIIPDFTEQEPNDSRYNYINQFIKGLSRENILKRVYHMSYNLFELTPPQTNLWKIDEDKWEQHV